MNIVLVRHGETIENATGIIQGQDPGNLSAKGVEQAKVVAKKLSNEHFDRVISSDLKRCVDTANEIMQFHSDVPINYAKELREMNFGDYQGLRSVDIDWDALPGDILNRRAPNAESGMEMRQRVVAFINTLLAAYHDETILIVTHGGPMRNIKSSIEKTDPLDILADKIDNCAVLRYKIDSLLTA